MHYDVIIIGAGMSGLAAGIRLAYFDRRVCIVEKHYAFGGLNSYYRIDGREYDVGLHAVTNYAPPERRSAPLAKLLRQLRLTREDFALCEQRFSEIRFPDCRLRFSNDIALLKEEVAERFPGDADNFLRLVSEIEAYDDTRLDRTYQAARPILRERLDDPMLIEMLLCPIMFYGSAEEHDMDFTQFVTMFKSLYLEGFARPREGVRRIIKAIVKKFRANGGEIRMRTGVDALQVCGERVVGVTLESGETLTGDVVISSAGYVETMRLCGDGAWQSETEEIGRISYVESIAVLDKTPAELGHDATIVFFNDAQRFNYARPDELVDLTSGIVCCPNNYTGHEELSEGVFRLTWLANHERWMGLDEEAYATQKRACLQRFFECGRRFLPDLKQHVVCTDMFTPRTIHRYTGHLNGAVYGSPHKRKDGRTPLANLFICGTDQGFLGIIGAMLSGITIANLHILSKS